MWQNQEVKADNGKVLRIPAITGRQWNKLKLKQKKIQKHTGNDRYKQTH